MKKPIPETISYLLAQVCKAHRGKGQELLSELDLHLGQEMPPGARDAIDTLVAKGWPDPIRTGR